MRVHLRTALLLALAIVLGSAGAARAWEAPYVEEGIHNGIEAAKKLKDLSGFGARADGVCLIGGFVENGKELTWKANLKGGKEYIFIGAGDRDVKDLDLKVFEGDNLVAEDTADDNTPITIVKAESDATATLKMIVEKAPGEGEKHFCLLIMLESEGQGGKLSQLEGVAKQLNAGIASMKDANVQFDQEKNTVCLVAGLLDNGAWKSFDRTFHGGQKYLMIGAGDGHCKDLDLEVAHEGQVVAKDEETDATPVVAISVAEENVRCSVKMTMHESDSPSFAVVAILTPKE